MTKFRHEKYGDVVYIVNDARGDSWCRVLGEPGVDLTVRARLIINAISFYLDHVRPMTKPGSATLDMLRTVNAAGHTVYHELPQMELHFPEE